MKKSGAHLVDSTFFGILTFDTFFLSCAWRSESTHLWTGRIGLRRVLALPRMRLGHRESQAI